MNDPPTTFRRPTDPPDPLPSIRGSDHVVRLHKEWARIHANADLPASRTLSRRLRDKTRGVASRFGTGNHDQLLGDLVRAVDALAARCDELSDRVANLEVSVDDVVRTFGPELTQLRAAAEQQLDESPGRTTPPQ